MSTFKCRKMAFKNVGFSHYDLLHFGLPLLWSTSSGTYGSHTMAVCGFKYYSKTTSWWTFSSTNYVLFYELRDGHSTQPRFFDMTGHYGFAAIINLNK